MIILFLLMYLTKKSRSLAFGLSLSLLAGLLINQPATAATCPMLINGDLFKVPKQSAVYQINDRGERMYFPNSEVFFTWHGDFKKVKEISPLCVDNYPLGGGVNYRPGTRLVKTEYSSNIYAIGPGNTRYKITDSAIAAKLYGPQWESFVRVLPEVFMLNLKSGDPIITAQPHNGQVVKEKNSDTIFVVRNNRLRPLADPANASYVREIDSQILHTLPLDQSGTSYTGVAYYDPGQKASQINWQVQIFLKVGEVLDFINGVGVPKIPAVGSIAGTPDAIYVFYRADLEGTGGWKLKESTEYADINDFLNGANVYQGKTPTEEAIFINRDKFYAFYRGENTAAKWGWAKMNNLNDMTDFVNGRQTDATAKIGTIGGNSEREPVAFYRLDLPGRDRWGWKNAPNLDDARQFLNGLNAYDQPVTEAKIINNDINFYIFYSR